MMFTDPILARVFYGSFLLVAFAAAWASESQTYIKLGVVAVGHWAAYNLIIGAFGYANSGVILVALSCVAAIISAEVGYSARSMVALWLVWLWIAGAALSTWFYYFKAQSDPAHYVALNLTFLARMLILGGAGMAELAGWSRAVPQRPHLRRSSG